MQLIHSAAPVMRNVDEPGLEPWIDPRVLQRTDERRNEHREAARRPDDANLHIPNWERESARHVPISGRRMLGALRAYQYHARQPGMTSRLLRIFANARHRFWSHFSRAHIPLNTTIGGGLLLLHPDGVIIHPNSIIGPNCMILQQVTIGNGGASGGCPKLGAGVDVGAGAKVLGPIVIGDGAKIGANAVVIRDVPAGFTAVGIPARNLPPKHLRDQNDHAQTRLTYRTDAVLFSHRSDSPDSP